VDSQKPQPKYPHENEPVCPYCQRKFISLDELTLHIVTRHTQSGKPAKGPAKVSVG
jgi:hypothetical protein